MLVDANLFVLTVITRFDFVCGPLATCGSSPMPKRKNERLRSLFSLSKQFLLLCFPVHGVRPQVHRTLSPKFVSCFGSQNKEISLPSLIHEVRFAKQELHETLSILQVLIRNANREIRSVKQFPKAFRTADRSEC